MRWHRNEGGRKSTEIHRGPARRKWLDRYQLEGLQKVEDNSIKTSWGAHNCQLMQGGVQIGYYKGRKSKKVHKLVFFGEDQREIHLCPMFLGKKGQQKQKREGMLLTGSIEVISSSARANYSLRFFLALIHKPYISVFLTEAIKHIFITCNSYYFSIFFISKFLLSLFYGNHFCG